MVNGKQEDMAIRIELKYPTPDEWTCAQVEGLFEFLACFAARLGQTLAFRKVGEVFDGQIQYRLRPDLLNRNPFVDVDCRAQCFVAPDDLP